MNISHTHIHLYFLFQLISKNPSLQKENETTLLKMLNIINKMRNTSSVLYAADINYRNKLISLYNVLWMGDILDKNCFCRPLALKWLKSGKKKMKYHMIIQIRIFTNSSFLNKVTSVMTTLGHKETEKETLCFALYLKIFSIT